jgi:hypothetical protein
MKVKEIEYMQRLDSRRRILAARLDDTPKGSSFRSDIQKEFNAINWAITELTKWKRIEDSAK